MDEMDKKFEQYKKDTDDKIAKLEQQIAHYNFYFNRAADATFHEPAAATSESFGVALRILKICLGESAELDTLHVPEFPRIRMPKYGLVSDGHWQWQEHQNLGQKVSVMQQRIDLLDDRADFWLPYLAGMWRENHEYARRVHAAGKGHAGETLKDYINTKEDDASKEAPAEEDNANNKTLAENHEENHEENEEDEVAQIPQAEVGNDVLHEGMALATDENELAEFAQHLNTILREKRTRLDLEARARKRARFQASDI